MARVALAVFALVASAGVAGAEPPDLSGRWSGYWASDTTGHTGPLHGRFRRVDADTYRVSFRGRFAGVVPFWYTTKLQVTGAGGGWVGLAASQRLPLAGEYRTAARATATNFGAAFTSRRDAGRFVLSRR